jgi:hypothetical protein
MTPRDNLRIISLLAKQIREKKSLTDDQLGYLQVCLTAIAGGSDANKVFGLKNPRGVTDKQTAARMRLSFIFHWVACAIKPDDDGNKGLSVDGALKEASIWSPRIFQRSTGTTYEFQYLKNQWYDPCNEHLKDCNRDPFDSDFPY